MSKLYTGMCGLCCLVLLAVISASTRADAQGARNVTPRTSWSDIRGNNPNPDMWQNKGASWSELMDEFENTPIIQQVFTTIIQTRTYDLTTLDNRLTSEAIAWEHVKQAVVDELTARITEEGKAAKNVSKKVYGVSAGISYELLPNQKDIKVILPSLILVEKTDGNQAKGTLRLKARARVAIARIVPMTFAVYGNEATYDEIKGVRRMATDAMSEIVRIQDASTGSREKSALNQRYLDAVNRLITADQLEKGRYFALRGESQQAVDAYTKALETSPGLAIAYRNRGGLYLHLDERSKAMADFLNAYTSDAIDHTVSRNFQACIDASEAALKLFEDYGLAYYQRAVCSVGLRQQEDAMKDFKRAAQLGEQRAQKLLSSKNIAW